MESVVGYILSGGVGSRLAPLSTAQLPKQYLRITGADSSLGDTIARLARLDHPVVNVIASADDGPHLEPYRRTISLTGGSLLLEPARRNTAMAIAVATAHALSRHGDRLMLVTPADHHVGCVDGFQTAVRAGVEAAAGGSLVLFGIAPTRPETGLGYIETADAASDAAILEVRRFREKPGRAAALAYAANRQHFWNCGMFLYRPSLVRDLFLGRCPATWRAALAALAEGSADETGMLLNPDAYAAIAPEQFDTLIVERARPVVMVRSEFRWRDLGSWRSIVEATLSPWQAP